MSNKGGLRIACAGRRTAPYDILGLAQVRYSASQRHAFCLRQQGTYLPFVWGFSALRAKKTHTLEK
jgi:hypothetical protein